MLLTNNAEGGSLGATVGTGGSGSGSAWNAVVGTPLITYDDVHAHGDLAYKVALTGTTTAQQLVWDSTSVGTVSEMWGRLYLWSSAHPADNRFGLVRFLVGGAQAARLIYETNGTLVISDAGNAPEVTTTATVATGQWVRIEWHIVFVAAAATIELRLYTDAESTTPTEVVSTAAAIGVGVNCDRVEVGAFLNALPSTWTGWIDDIEVNTTGWPGPVPAPATLSVVQQWTGTGGRDDVRVNVNPTPGHWLIVTLAYRKVGGDPPLATVADLASNWWMLCGSRVHSNGLWVTEVWACPAVEWAPWQLDIVYAAVSHIHADDTGSVLVHVAEIQGFANGFPQVTAFASPVGAASGTFSITMPAPSANSMCLAVASISDTTKTITVTSAGWTALTTVQRPGPDLEMAPAWRESAAGDTVSWQVDSGTAVWLGMVVAIAVAGEEWDQPNPAWPAVRVQLGRGHRMETPLPRVTWSDETSRLEEFYGTRGIQNELGRPQAAEINFALRNYDDGVTPDPAGDIDMYVPYQLLAAWDGKVYALHSGWAESFRRRWEDPHHGLVDVQAVDAIATLIANVPSAIKGEILRHRPWAYWPLGDQGGSKQALNVSPRTSFPLTVSQSKFGAGSGSADFGAALNLSGDPGTGWAQTGLAVADTKQGAALVGRGTFPLIANGVTIVGWTWYDSATLGSQPNADHTLCIIRNLNAKSGRLGSILKVAISEPLGVPEVTVWDKDTGASTVFADDANFLSTTRARPWAIRFDRNDFRADFGGTGFTPVTGACDLASEFGLISVGGEADEFFHGLAGNLAHGHVAVFDRRLTDEELSQLMDEANTGWFNDEDTHQRLQRTMATAGSSVPRAFDESSATNSRDGRDGGILAQRAADLADYEAGLLWGDASAALRFRSADLSYQQSPKWTLGDDTASGEIPFQPGLSTAYEPTYLFNRAVMHGHQENVLFYDAEGSLRFLTDAELDQDHIATDGTSRDRYQERPLERDVWLYDTARAQHLADWLLALYSTPRQRVATATVDAAAYPAAWPLVLSVEVGDLITVIRRPVGQAPITVPCRVMQIRHQLVFREGGTVGQVELTLAAAPAQVLVCGSGRTLGTSTIGW